MLERQIPRWVMVLVTLVCYGALASKLTNPVFDPDTWWHLKVGQWVAEHGTVPQTDPFSRMSQENPTPWVAYSWLYELLLWKLNVYGVKFCLVLGSLVALHVFIEWHVGRTIRGLFYLGSVTATLLPLATERPWHLTMIFCTFTLHSIISIRNGISVRNYWWLPLVFVLWANIHIQFVLGWAILGLACLFPGYASRKHVLILSVLCGFAVLVNPYHVRLLVVIWDYATQAQAMRLVNELQPPEWTSPVTWVVLICIGISLSTVIRRGNRIDWFDILIILLGAFFALRMLRDLWFGVLCASASSFISSRYIRRRSIIILGAGTGVIFACGYVSVPGNKKHLEFSDDGYPWKSIDHVKQHNLPGPLFNTFDWGGFLIYNLPTHPVSIDGRTNLYGNERLLRNYHTMLAEPGWAQDPDLLQANLVILPRQIPLTDALFLNGPEWTLDYQDDVAVVFVRKK